MFQDIQIKQSVLVKKPVYPTNSYQTLKNLSSALKINYTSFVILVIYCFLATAIVILHQFLFYDTIFTGE